MLYLESLFSYVQMELAEALAQFPMTVPQPLDCDRWIARSALQKTIRRGEVELAQRALANLFAHDPASVWRHIAIICVEDVGVANVDLLAQIVAAKRDKMWRRQMPAIHMIGDVPGYALDQFTRTGNQISRAYLNEDEELRTMFEQAGMTKGAYARTLGDVLFLIEGGLAKNRIIWPVAEALSQPRRWLPAVATLGQHLPAIIRHCQAKASQIKFERLRSHNTRTS